MAAQRQWPVIGVCGEAVKMFMEGMVAEEMCGAAYKSVRY